MSTTPGSRETVSILISAIAQAFDMPPDDLNPETVVASLELDSLAFTEALLIFEDEVGQELPGEVLDEVTEIFDGESTLADVAKALDASLSVTSS